MMSLGFKKSVFIGWLTLMPFLVSLSYASTEFTLKNTKIAVLDMDYIMEHAKASVSLRNKVEEQRIKTQELIKKLEDELRLKEKKLIEDQTSLKPEVMEDRKIALEKEFEHVQEMVSEKKVQLSKNFDDGMMRIQNAIRKIVETISTDQGYSLILPKSLTIYSLPSMDITQQVITTLNEKLPSPYVSPSLS